MFEERVERHVREKFTDLQTFLAPKEALTLAMGPAGGGGCGGGAAEGGGGGGGAEGGEADG